MGIYLKQKRTSFIHSICDLQVTSCSLIVFAPFNLHLDVGPCLILKIFDDICIGIAVFFVFRSGENLHITMKCRIVPTCKLALNEGEC